MSLRRPPGQGPDSGAAGDFLTPSRGRENGNVPASPRFAGQLREEESNRQQRASSRRADSSDSISPVDEDVVGGVPARGPAGRTTFHQPGRHPKQVPHGPGSTATGRQPEPHSAGMELMTK